MITMITGVPGMGKTALLVSMLLEEEIKAERPLFVMGVNGLLLEHNKCPPVIEWTEKRPDPDDNSLMLDYFLFPPNSILIIDEAQRVFRTRSAGSKVPSHVSALETHRHTGLDVWLLTQKPLLIDSNVRELTGRHIHIRNSILGRRLYEWPEFRDVNNISNLKDAIKRRFSPPKEAFAYYKSAEVHTKQQRRTHQVFPILLICLALLGYFGNKAYDRIFKKASFENQDSISTLDVLASPQAIKASLTPNHTIEQDVQVVQNSEAVHPFLGYTFQISGTLKSKRLNLTYYKLTNSTNSITINDVELKKLGYEINQPSDCASFLYFQGAQILATCRSDAAAGDALQRGNEAAALTQRGLLGGLPPDVDAFNIPPNSVGLASPASPNNSSSM